MIIFQFEQLRKISFSWFLTNLVIKNSEFPDCLKVARVTPLFKKGDPTDPNNYRPISILPSLSKIVEKILSSQVRTYLDSNHMITKFQFGFTRGKSTTDAINILLEKFYHNFDEGKVTQGVFLDFSKAFDTINHGLLIEKLKFYSFGNESISLIKNYLQNRYQFVINNNIHSSLKPVSIGVPQGSIMGPLLFLIYINDLVKCIPSLDCILFADDTNVFSTNNVDMKAQLPKLQGWCLKNRLVLNSDKTFQVIFKNPQKSLDISDYELTMRNKLLSVKPTAKFLGVVLDENLSFKYHFQHLIKKLQYALLLMRYAGQYLDRETMINFYYSFFYPHIIYGIEFWGYAGVVQMDKILILQKKALRTILKLKYNDTVSDYFKKLQIMPIKMLFEYRFLIHFVKTYQENLSTLLVHHDHETRSQSLNLLKTHKFKSTKGQRSMLFTGVRLFNKYFKNSDFKSLTASCIREKLAARLWDAWG